jgi:hypothetical protein
VTYRSFEGGWVLPTALGRPGFRGATLFRPRSRRISPLSSGEGRGSSPPGSLKSSRGLPSSAAEGPRPAEASPERFQRVERASWSGLGELQVHLDWDGHIRHPIAEGDWNKRLPPMSARVFIDGARPTITAAKRAQRRSQPRCNALCLRESSKPFATRCVQTNGHDTSASQPAAPSRERAPPEQKASLEP